MASCLLRCSRLEVGDENPIVNGLVDLREVVVEEGAGFGDSASGDSDRSQRPDHRELFILRSQTDAFGTKFGASLKHVKEGVEYPGHHRRMWVMGARPQTNRQEDIW